MTINIQQHSSYWKRESAYSYRLTKSLFDKHDYPEALFFGHLALEKILKALVVQSIKDASPLIHDLERLGELAKLPLTKQQRTDLKEITTFNIAGRYDNIKQSFRRKCTKTFSKKYFELIQHYYKWLEKELSQSR